MRARLLKPGFFKNDDLGRLPPLARLLFEGLWCVADRQGRVEDRPARIKGEVLPYDEADADGLLELLAAAGFIVRYRAGGARYIQVVNFGKHQSPHVREPESAIPAPDGHQASTGPAPDGHQASPAVTGIQSLNPEAEAVTGNQYPGLNGLAGIRAPGGRARAREGADAPCPPPPPAAPASDASGAKGAAKGGARKKPPDRATPGGYELLAFQLALTRATLKGDARRRAALHADELVHKCGSVKEAKEYVEARYRNGDSPDLAFCARDYSEHWREKMARLARARAGPGNGHKLSYDEQQAALDQIMAEG